MNERQNIVGLEEDNKTVSISFHIHQNNFTNIIDEILSPPITPDKLWVEKKCKHLFAPNRSLEGKIVKARECPDCQGTVIIRREATWGNVDIEKLVYRYQDIKDEAETALIFIDKGNLEAAKKFLNEILKDVEDALSLPGGGN